MQERLKELLNKVVEWWKGLKVKQRTMIVCGAAVIVLVLAVVITLISRPEYTLLKECETASEGAQIKQILDDEGGYTYRISDDGLRVEVATAQLGNANLLLASNSIVSDQYTIDKVTEGGLGVTEADKQKRYIEMLQDELEHDFLGMFDVIDRATVMLHVPEQNGTLIAVEQESSATVALQLNGEFSSDNAAFLARAVATALGNETTDNISIIDTTTGNMLFSGDDNFYISGTSNSPMVIKQESEEAVGLKVKNALKGTNNFDNIEAAVNLVIDFSDQNIVDHNYYAPENSTQGLLAEARIYNSDATGGQGDIPGTDSNEESPTYVYDRSGIGNTSTSEEEYKYAPSERITTTTNKGGIIDYQNSSVGITAIDYIIVQEEMVRSQGLLDGLSWEEYKAQNSGRRRIENDADWINVVAMSTGIPAENISIVAYEENWFVDRESNIETTDVIAFVLILLILGLLAFVILRSMMRERVPEEPEEPLPVDELLQSTPEEVLETIETEPKSEEQLILEKFVQENPEAAANLLRNWLNEEWG